MIQWLIGLFFSEFLGGGLTIGLLGALTVGLSGVFLLQGARVSAGIVFVLGAVVTALAGGLTLGKVACDTRIAAFQEQIRQAEDAERERQAENRQLIRDLDIANAKLTTLASEDREKVIINERRILVQNPDCARWSGDEFARLHKLRKTRRSGSGD